MYREHDRQTVHRLRARGYSKAAIARTLGVSHNTVDKLLKLHEPPVFARRDTLTRPFCMTVSRRR